MFEALNINAVKNDSVITTFEQAVQIYKLNNNEQRAYSIALLMNSINRLPYCSGSQVDIPSTLAPYFTVLAAFAACLRTP